MRRLRPAPSPAAPGVRLRVAEIPLPFVPGWDDGVVAAAPIATRSLPQSSTPPRLARALYDALVPPDPS